MPIEWPENLKVDKDGNVSLWENNTWVANIPKQFIRNIELRTNAASVTIDVARWSIQEPDKK